MPTPDPPRPGSAAQHVVTAVLVAHEGQYWLPRTVAAIAAQTRQPERLLAADSSSTDASAVVLSQLVGNQGILHVARSTGFGASVALALQTDGRRRGAAGRRAAAPPAEPSPPVPAPTGILGSTAEVEWLWLLHDDCEPAPDALAQLLRLVESDPSIAVAGPKIRAWHERRLLLEVGVSIARSGRRETGLERREQDQGQHDGVHDRLAVSTAGMLVRRDVWEALGGLDRAFPLFRDDVDFGWRANLAGHRVVCCTDAVVYHAEAAARGRRSLAPVIGRRGRADRRSAIAVLLYNLPLSSLPWTLVRILLGSLLTILTLLVGRAPRAAVDEVVALLSVLVRPDRIVRARLLRRSTRVRPARSVLPLLAGAAANVRHAMEILSATFGTGASAMVGAGAHRAVETGPGGDAADNLPTWRTVLVRRVVGRPPILLALGLVAVTIAASRDLLVDGRLLGGALLPAPDSAADLWRSYLSGWHPVGVGSDTSAPPYLAVMAALATVLFGSASLAVDVLLLAAVPAAGLTMYAGMSAVLRSVPLRLWAACVYAFSPPLVAAVAAGRIGTSVAAVLLPALGALAVRAVGGSGQTCSARAAWAAGIVLAAVSAFTPVVYVLAAALSLPTILFRRGVARRHVGIILLAPLLLLVPWLPAVVADPRLLLQEAGLPGPGLADHELSGWSIILLHPGGPGAYPAYFTLGVVLAALAALLRRDRRAALVACWIAAGVAMAAAVVLSRTSISGAAPSAVFPGWPGPTLLVAVGALAVAGAVGADGARVRVARSSFGWRQPASVVLAGLAAAAPVLAAGWWIADGSGDPLNRRDPVLLPAFVAAEANQPERPRALVLLPDDTDRLSYALLRAEGPRLGDAEMRFATSATRRLDGVVSSLASGTGSEAAADLLPYGVRFVLLSRTADAARGRALVRALDGVPGLVPVSGSATSRAWKVDLPVGRARVLRGLTAAGSSSEPGKVLPAGAVDVHAEVPPGPPVRWVVLAESRDTGWRATLGGSPLRARTYDGWAQAFALPPAGGTLHIDFDQGYRSALLWVQLAALVGCVVLTLPSARPSEDTDDGLSRATMASSARRARQPPRLRS